MFILPNVVEISRNERRAKIIKPDFERSEPYCVTKRWTFVNHERQHLKIRNYLIWHDTQSYRIRTITRKVGTDSILPSVYYFVDKKANVVHLYHEASKFF